MSGSVCIAIKKNGAVISGEGYKACSGLASSWRLLQGDDEALRELSEDILDDLGGLAYPVSYGIVAIDLDAKTIHSHQGYSRPGQLTYGYGWETEELNSDFAWHSQAGMIWDAAKAGKLLDMFSKAQIQSNFRTPSELLAHLQARAGDQSRCELYVDLDGWETKTYAFDRLHDLHIELSRAGWPQSSIPAEQWHEFAAEGSEDSGPTEAAVYFKAAMDSAREKAELSQALPAPAINKRSRF